MGVKVKQMQFTTVHYSKLINLVFVYYLTVLMLSRSLFSLSDGNENAFATVVNVQLQSSELIHCEKRRRKYSHQTKIIYFKIIKLQRMHQYPNDRIVSEKYSIL